MKLIVIFVVAIAVLARADQPAADPALAPVDGPTLEPEPLPVTVPITDAESAAWTEYVAKFNKVYASDEETEMRKGTFVDNYRLVQQYQEAFKNKETTFNVEINKLSDLTPEEYQLKYNGFWRGPALENPLRFQKNRASSPPTMDWRTVEGVVSPVKSQGECASCWAVVTADVIQAHSAIKTGQSVPLSAQQILDCSDLTGTYGCDGGWIDSAFKYVKAIGGLESEEKYPYVGLSNADCAFNKSDIATGIVRFVELEAGKEQSLKDAVAQVGPIAVAVDGSKWSFQHYAGGVYYEPLCSSEIPDRSLLVVGYGTEDDQDYWLAKNSLGADWGDNGYIKIARNKKNHCGITNEATYPVIA